MQIAQEHVTRYHSETVITGIWQTAGILDDSRGNTGWFMSVVFSEIIRYILYIILFIMCLEFPASFYRAKTIYQLDLEGKTLLTTSYGFVNSKSSETQRFDRILNVMCVEDTAHRLFGAGRVILECLVYENAGTREVQLELQDIENPTAILGRLRPLVEADAALNLAVKGSLPNT
jgi:hypothetical protein